MASIPKIRKGGREGGKEGGKKEGRERKGQFLLVKSQILDEWLFIRMLGLSLHIWQDGSTQIA